MGIMIAAMLMGLVVITYCGLKTRFCKSISKPLLAIDKSGTCVCILFVWVWGSNVSPLNSYASLCFFTVA